MQGEHGSTGRRSFAAHLRSNPGRRPFVAPSTTVGARFSSSAPQIHDSSHAGFQGSSPAGIRGSSPAGVQVSSPADVRSTSPAGGHGSSARGSSPAGVQVASPAGVQVTSPAGILGSAHAAGGHGLPSARGSSPGAPWAAGSSTPFSDLLQSSDSFMNYMMGQQHNPSENAHFVGGASHFTQVDEAHDNLVDVESDDANEGVRTEARLIWKPEEDGRVMSAWLKHSIDPIRGNNKKSKKYWFDVQKEYNQHTVKNRWRTTKQVKDRWHKVKKEAEIPVDLNVNPGASIALPPEVSTQANPCFADVLRRNSEIRDHSKHIELKNDLVEHIWQRYGHQFRAQQ